MKLITERLGVIPLLPNQVGSLAGDISAFEDDFGYAYKGERLEGHLLDVTKGQHSRILADIDNHLWHTFWMLMLEDERIIIGSACFKGPPDIDGTVEIGYGVAEEFCNNGYVSEAVGALCAWALNQPGVKGVIAETEKMNPASHRVLEKNGFIKYKETRDCYWWRRD